MKQDYIPLRKFVCRLAHKYSHHVLHYVLHWLMTNVLPDKDPLIFYEYQNVIQKMQEPDISLVGVEYHGYISVLANLINLCIVNNYFTIDDTDNYQFHYDIDNVIFRSCLSIIVIKVLKNQKIKKLNGKMR